MVQDGTSHVEQRVFVRVNLHLGVWGYSHFLSFEIVKTQPRLARLVAKLDVEEWCNLR